jgi:hypothetical protein
LLIPREGTTAEDLWIAAATIRLERWRFNYGRKITPPRICNLLVRRDAQIQGFVSKWLSEAVRPITRETVRSLAEGESPRWAKASEQRFTYLRDLWRAETAKLSSVTKKCTHPAYQEIIGMGEGAIPFILQDLKDTQADWFWALTAITGQNPITEDDAGNIDRMTQAWLKWSTANGY